MRFLHAIVLTLQLAPAALSAQEAVTLDFAWPAGAAEVSVTTTVSAGAMGPASTFDTRMDYRLTVEEGDEGLRVSYSDFTFDGTGMDEFMAGVAGGEDLSRAIANMQPDILVSADGRFLGLSNYADLRASLEEMIASMRSQMEAMGAGAMFDEMMEGTVSEEAMSRSAELSWDQMVGYWAGRTLVAGEAVSVPGEMVVPMLGNQPVAVDTELELVGRVPCSEEGGIRECVELISRASPDAEQIRNLADVFMAEMMERSGGTGMEVGISAMSLSTVHNLVVETETLRPLRMETVVEMTMSMDMMGTTQTLENRQVARTRFDWDPF